MLELICNEALEHGKGKVEFEIIDGASEFDVLN